MKKSIFYIVSDYQGCGWYRCHVPGVELKKRNYDVVLDHNAYAGYLDADVVVVSRPCSAEHLDAIRYANSTGHFTVCDVDDNIWDVKPINPAYEFWRNPENIAVFDSCLKEAKMITTTTVYLANLLRNRNKNIAILPNMLPDDHWPEKKRDYAPEKVKLGWAGGTSHYADLKMVTGVVKQVVEEIDNLELHLLGNFETMGNPFDGFPSVIHDIVKLEGYSAAIRKFDIGFIPVEDNNFNKYKSDLKYLEYAAVGLPVIASDISVYADSIVHNEIGLLAKNAKDWLKCLRKMATDSQLRERIGRNARKYIESRMISKNIGLWEKAFGLKR